MSNTVICPPAFSLVITIFFFAIAIITTTFDHVIANASAVSATALSVNIMAFTVDSTFATYVSILDHLSLSVIII